MSLNLDDKTMAEADALIADRQLIMAIKLIRERTGCDLLTAKQWVDQRVAGGGAASKPAPIVSPARGPSAVMPKIDRLIREGNLIDAIKEYRDATGLGLRESKDFVDARKKEIAGTPSEKTPLTETDVALTPEEKRRLEAEQAERFAGPKKAGCLGMLAWVAAGFLIWRWL